MHRRRLLAGIIGAALVVAACGTGATPEVAGTTGGDSSAATATTGDGGSASSSTSAATTTTTGDGTSTDGEPAGAPHEALAFQAPLIQGGTFDGPVSGDVVVWFWAPW